MPDYTKGKIYKIVCNITGEIYIGSTIQPLSRRLSGHVIKKNTDKKYKSKDIILRGDYQIVLIENYSCNSREELEKKEREHIENNICVNRYIPTRTTKEYYEENKEKIDNYKKEHYSENIVHFTKYKKDWYEKNKEEVKRKARERYHNKKNSIL
jgi:hypothetical protein